MTNALVAINVSNLRVEPSTHSEVVTQSVMGAVVRVGNEEGDNWRHVKTEDRYQGWIRADHLVPVWDDGDHFKTSIATLFAEVYPQADESSEMLTKLVVSTKVAVAHRPEIDDWVPLRLPDGRIGYVHKLSLNITHEGGLTGPDLLDQKARRSLDVSDLKRRVLKAVGQQACAVAKRFIGTPYLWGGCTPFGLDCSGFVQIVYKLSGIQLLRDAGLQFADRRFEPAEPGQPFDEADFEPGDLVGFRKQTDGPITHIGLALGDGRFIHSAGGVGVHLAPCHTQKYVATYAGAVRISPGADLAIEAA